MPEESGAALAAFDQALTAFRARLDAFPALQETIFAEAAPWVDLLRYKLVPHLAGEGCLFVAVAGGTNTGKSTVFNLLLGGDVSPVRSTAAATCRPVLAAHPDRAKQCLAGELVPEFDAVPLENAEAVVSREEPPNRLFVYSTEKLPKHRALLDTPDVDSIDQQNWAVAEHILAAGDVLIAVLTGEKYKDDRVINFFRRAHAAGRLVLPLMNKADADNDFEVARAQLKDFCNDAELGNDIACFAAPRDNALSDATNVRGITNEASLPDYLDNIDVDAIKAQAYRGSIAHFAEEASQFLDQLRQQALQLQEVREEFRKRAQNYAEKFEPAPSPAVGHLFHQFVQSKRGAVGQAMGTASTAITRTSVAIGSQVTRIFGGGRPAPKNTPEAEVYTQHRNMLHRIGRELAASYYDSARNLGAPAQSLVLADLEALDTDAAVEAAAKETIKAEDISEDFREHAEAMLETWWNDHTWGRNVLIALDRLLMVTPAAIAGVMAVHTAGVGVPEVMLATSPVVGKFAARVLEYQFGDALFDFLTPWRREQQENFCAALETHMLEPMLRSLDAATGALDGDETNAMREALEQCRKA